MEESEKYAQLVALIIKSLGKEWREETDDDAQVIALDAIDEIKGQRDFAIKELDRVSGALIRVIADHDDLKERFADLELTWSARFSEQDNEMLGCLESFHKATAERDAALRVVEAAQRMVGSPLTQHPSKSMSPDDQLIMAVEKWEAAQAKEAKANE